MITKTEAMALKHRDIIYENTLNKNGEPARWYVNGVCKTWKTRPDEFRLPLKHGLYTYGALDHHNNKYLFLTEEDAIASAKKAGLTP